MAQLAKTLETVCTQACLEKEKRPDLLLVAKHYSLDVPTAGNSQYQTKADFVKLIMFDWANHDLLDSGEMDRHGMREGEIADAVETIRDDVETTREPACT